MCCQSFFRCGMRNLDVLGHSKLDFHVVKTYDEGAGEFILDYELTDFNLM